MDIQSVKSSILQDNIDLDGLESLLQYLAIGFTFSTSFRILKRGGVSAQIPITEADRLKQQFFKQFGNKPKSYLRSRLPILLLGLAVFSKSRAEGTPLNERLVAFRQGIESLDSGAISDSDLEDMMSMVRDGLGRPYYTRRFNRALDPVAQFFDGRAPNSYSNAIQECIHALVAIQAARQVPGSTITVVKEPERDLRLLEDDRVYTRVEEPLPNVDIINAPTEEKVPSVTVSASSRRLPDLAYGALGIFIGLSLSYAISKVRQK